jgi:hypothetical protein
MHDGGERVGELALFERLPQCDLLNLAPLRGNQLFAHDLPVLRAAAMNKR